jgi:ankyrin repeat protein
MLVFAGANLSGLNRPFSQVRSPNREMYRSPLTLAAQAGYLDALRFLLERGAEIEAENHFGDTPLIEALTYGQAEAAQILIAAGADVHREPYHPFQLADTLPLVVVQSQRLDLEQKADLIRRMIEAGADINKPNQIGDSPLLAAIRLGADYRFAIMGFTDPSGAYEDRVVRLSREPKWPQAQIAPLIRALTAGGADVNARDREGKTAREVAQEAGLTELAALL